MQTPFFITYKAQITRSVKTAWFTEYLLDQGYLLPKIDVSDIQEDNRQTDEELRNYLGYGITATPLQELHFVWCENSGIQECVCLSDPNKRGETVFV